MKLPVKKKVLIWSIIAAVVIVGLIIGLYYAYKVDEKDLNLGAVVSNGIECAGIGEKILRQDGTAVDAAIATLFCEGITCPQSMGLGGGFIATIYKRKSKKIETLIAREVAPRNAHKDMFVNKTVEGGLAVAVPGELKGYWEMHQKYGKLSWKLLIEPSIKLCRQGHIVTPYLANVMKVRENLILQTPSLKEILINPETGKVWNEGDRIKRLKLAETLEIIASEGPDVIYNGGSIGKLLVEDIQEFGGIITEEDFRDYKVIWSRPDIVQMAKDLTLYTTPLPASGPVLSYILNLLNGYLGDVETIRWQRIIESFKHAYGLRSQLGDINFVPEIRQLVENMTNPDFAYYVRQHLMKDNETSQQFEYYGANFSQTEDHGTANIAILAPNGDAVTVTSTINNILGAKIRSSKTGIILNDEMDDFSNPGADNGFAIPPSPANFIKPGKRPLSSMCPSIILNKEGDVRLLIGAAGGSKITTSVAQVIVRHLLLNEKLDDAIQSKRLHHQLSPMLIQHEIGFNKKIMSALAQIGHQLKPVPIESGFSAVTAISSANGKVSAVFDIRRTGSSVVFRPK